MAYSDSQDLLSSPVDPQSMPQPVIHAFPSRLTRTTTYIVVDPVTEEAAIINPILDLDPITNEIRTRSADRLLKFVNDEGLTIKFILETTLHRDRISACRYLQLTLKHIGDGVVPKVCVGENSFCTCGDDSADESASAPSPPQPTNATPKSPEAFDHLFDDGEHLRIGNMMATVTHLDDHAGVTYRVAQHTFSSTTLSHSADLDPNKGVINHPEPPPDKTPVPGVSARAKPSIDEVLGSAEKLSLDGGGGGGSSGADSPTTPDQQSPPPQTSPLLAFYAEQVNTRGGRIPRKINMPPSSSSLSAPPAAPRTAAFPGASPLSQQSSSSEEAGVNGASPTMPTTATYPSTANAKGKERAGTRDRKSSTGAAAPMPLRIPRKLGGIMC